MAIHTSEAIVLGTRELRETSLIVTFYTKAFGKVAGVMKGVRGARALHGGGALEPFARDEIVFYDRKTSDLFFVSQCDLIDYFPAIRADLERLSYAMYLIELVDSFTPLGDRNEELFLLLARALALLVGKSSPRRVARIFEIRMLGLLGMMPQMYRCVQCRSSDLREARFSLRMGGLVCKRCAPSDRAAVGILPGTIEFIRHIETSDLDTISRIKVSERVGKDLEGALRRFLDYHLERRMRTVTFLKSLGMAR